MGQNKRKQLEISSEANSGKKEKLFMEHAFADSPFFCLRRCRITFWQNGGENNSIFKKMLIYHEYVN